MEHTKEPWLLNRYGTVHVGDDSRPVLLAGFSLNMGHPSPLAESNTRRIVACVNACAGLPLERLEQVPPITNAKDWVDTVLQWRDQRDHLESENAKQAELLNRVIEQRDELLAAAEPALVALEKSTQFSLGVPSFEFASAKLRATIAKVKP